MIDLEGPDCAALRSAITRIYVSSLASAKGQRTGKLAIEVLGGLESGGPFGNTSLGTHGARGRPGHRAGDSSGESSGEHIDNMGDCVVYEAVIEPAKGVISLLEPKLRA